MSGPGISAVLFDLDDTLYPQAEWLSGAWEAVAVCAPPGISPPALLRSLHRIASEGSDRGFIIDRALEAMGVHHVDVAPMVEAFRSHAPARLHTYPGVVDGLALLRQRVPIGLVTDGDPAGQKAKLKGLGLEESFDAVVFSDALGRERRKPHPAPFRRAGELLGVDLSGAVYVGDRPDKDVAGAVTAGMRPIRVRSGEYATRPSRPSPWLEFPDVASCLEHLLAVLPVRSSGVHSDG